MKIINVWLFQKNYSGNDHQVCCEDKLMLPTRTFFMWPWPCFANTYMACPSSFNWHVANWSKMQDKNRYTEEQEAVRQGIKGCNRDHKHRQACATNCLLLHCASKAIWVAPLVSVVQFHVSLFAVFSSFPVLFFPPELVFLFIVIFFFHFWLCWCYHRFLPHVQYECMIHWLIHIGTIYRHCYFST